MKTVADIFRSYGVLDANGRHVNGTDKETNHRYGDAYERIIGIKRVSAKLVMEVGIAGGASLLGWGDVFPYAHCVGLDIMPDAESMLRGYERMEFHVGDASKRENCERAAAGRQFDFICEDASHRAGDSLLTLLYLWKYIAPGGLYVIEEFYEVGALYNNIKQLWPFAEIVETQGPFGGIEPLVVLKKQLWDVDYPKHAEYRPV